MKDKPARVLAVIALVFMVIFIVSFTAMLIDYTWLNGGVGIIALCSGIFVLMVFIALKADGRGFSLTKMKNESEMKKIEQLLKEQSESEQSDKVEESDAEAVGKEGTENTIIETELPTDDINVDGDRADS